MKLIGMVLLMAVALLGQTDPRAEVLAIEKQVMEGWLKGDPGPQLAVADEHVTLLHEAVGRRIEGLAAVRKLYGQYTGTPLFDRYEMLSPVVHVTGDVVVLTYQLAQHNGAAASYWNGTVVYRKRTEGWRMIHSHWSAAKERVQ